MPALFIFQTLLEGNFFFYWKDKLGLYVRLNCVYLLVLTLCNDKNKCHHHTTRVISSLPCNHVRWWGNVNRASNGGEGHPNAESLQQQILFDLWKHGKVNSNDTLGPTSIHLPTNFVFWVTCFVIKTPRHRGWGHIHIHIYIHSCVCVYTQNSKDQLLCLHNVYVAEITTLPLNEMPVHHRVTHLELNGPEHLGHIIHRGIKTILQQWTT